MTDPTATLGGNVATTRQALTGTGLSQSGPQRAQSFPSVCHQAAGPLSAPCSGGYSHLSWYPLAQGLGVCMGTGATLGVSETISVRSHTASPSVSIPALDATALAAARRINLTRGPHSDTARAFVSAVANLLEPHVGGKRVMGKVGRVAFSKHVGTVLAGVIQSSWTGGACQVQQGQSGDMWQASPLIGHSRFWKCASAMNTAGLLGIRDGIRLGVDWGDGSTFGGLPARVWATDSLRGLAASHGVTAQTSSTDWRINPKAQIKRRRVTASLLVTCKHRPSRNVRGLRVGGSKGPALRANVNETSTPRKFTLEGVR